VELEQITMNQNINIIKNLYAVQDAAYRNFNSSLIPNISDEKFIGVRTPILKQMAKDIIKSGMAEDFVAQLPHKYFEENQLHAFILSDIHDFDTAIHKIEKFLPFVDNWATCDQMSPRCFAKNREALLIYIKKWIKSKDVYVVRFAVLNLMRYFIDSDFDVKYADMVADIKSDEYYVNMMRAWYFATGAAKHFDLFLPYFKAGRIDKWTRRRAIQKTIESYRIENKHKEILRALR
jgi:3-methyladenine DNA glycosylase AlkD